MGRFISADTIVPSAGNPQHLNRYSYVRNSPLNLVDPSGHVDCRRLPDEDATACLISKVFKSVNFTDWEAAYNELDEETLVDIFNKGGYAEFEDYQFVSEGEFNELLDAVTYDIRQKFYAIGVTWPGPEFEPPVGYIAGGIGGRGRYDTPFWNNYKEDTVVCIEGHGCWRRSEINYFAQGMWGARGGESLNETLQVVEYWNREGGKWQNRGLYGQSATEGELYWAEFGYIWYAERYPAMSVLGEIMQYNLHTGGNQWYSVPLFPPTR